MCVYTEQYLLGCGCGILVCVEFYVWCGMLFVLLRNKGITMKKFVVIQSGAGLWASPQILKARSFKSALQWCFSHGYDLIEEA